MALLHWTHAHASQVKVKHADRDGWGGRAAAGRAVWCTCYSSNIVGPHNDGRLVGIVEGMEMDEKGRGGAWNGAEAAAAARGVGW